MVAMGRIVETSFRSTINESAATQPTMTDARNAVVGAPLRRNAVEVIAVALVCSIAKKTVTLILKFATGFLFQKPGMRLIVQ